MTWLELLLATLATYRVARVVSQEDFAFDAFARFRGWIGQSSWVGRDVHCYACVSFWVAGIAAVVLIVQGYAAWSQLWYLWPGLAGSALAAYQVFR